MSARTIIDFKNNQDSNFWQVVDDGVMGGRSKGNFEVTSDGHGRFHGTVSLENNGGFSSVRFDMNPLEVTPNSKIQIRLKGDGNTYQFRVKSKNQEYHCYSIDLDTTGKWQTLEFTLSDLSPTFRGRKLDMPNFDKNTIEGIRFLIGNKKEQKFLLLIESLELF